MARPRCPTNSTLNIFFTFCRSFPHTHTLRLCGQRLSIFVVEIWQVTNTDGQMKPPFYQYFNPYSSRANDTKFSEPAGRIFSLVYQRWHKEFLSSRIRIVTSSLYLHLSQSLARSTYIYAILHVYINVKNEGKSVISDALCFSYVYLRRWNTYIFNTLS